MYEWNKKNNSDQYIIASFIWFFNEVEKATDFYKGYWKSMVVLLI